MVSISKYVTKRPLNKCQSCEYTFYPRGRDVSRKCPNCGSGNVDVAPFGMLDLIALAVVLIGAVYFIIDFRNYVDSEEKKKRELERKKRIALSESARKRSMSISSYKARYSSKRERSRRNSRPEWLEIPERKPRNQYSVSSSSRSKDKVDWLILQMEKKLSKVRSIDVKNNPKKKHLTIEYAVYRICKESGVTYLKKKSRKEVPSLKSMKIPRVRSNYQSSENLIRVLLSSRGLTFRLSKKGLFITKKQ